MSVQYNPSIVTSGLTLCLDPGNVKSYPGSGTAVSDLSTLRNNGSIIGTGMSYSATNGGTFAFNGSEGYVGTFGTDISNTSRSLCSFFNTSTTNRISLGGNRDAFGWAVCVNRNAIGSLSYFHASGPGLNDANATSANIQLNTWYYACATYDVTSATVVLYLNGQQILSVPSFGTVTPATSETGRIGSEPGSSPFAGSVGSTHLYNRALTAAEIRQNFNALRGRYGI